MRRESTRAKTAEQHGVDGAAGWRSMTSRHTSTESGMASSEATGGARAAQKDQNHDTGQHQADDVLP